jgi:hypothetical protein
VIHAVLVFIGLFLSASFSGLSLRFPQVSRGERRGRLLVVSFFRGESEAALSPPFK